MVSHSDMPEVNDLQEKLTQADFQKFPPIKDKLIAQVNHMLDRDIADLMSIVPTDVGTEPLIRGGAFDDVKDTISPFGFKKCEGKQMMCSSWVVENCSILMLAYFKLLSLKYLHNLEARRPNFLLYMFPGPS